MKVKLSEVPEEGLTLLERLDPETLGLGTPDLKFPRPPEVSATFHKERDTVRVEVDVSGQTEQLCARCLERFGRPYGERFHLGYSTQGLVELDITDDVRQEVLLSFPVRCLCREDCRGLCPQCGANRNERSCSHGSS